MPDLRRRDLPPALQNSILDDLGADSGLWGHSRMCWMSTTPGPKTVVAGERPWGNPASTSAHRASLFERRRSLAATVPWTGWGVAYRSSRASARYPPPPRNSMFDGDGLAVDDGLMRWPSASDHFRDGRSASDVRNFGRWESCSEADLAATPESDQNSAYNVATPKCSPRKEIIATGWQGGRKHRLDGGKELSVCSSRREIGPIGNPRDPRQSVAALKKSKEYLDYARGHTDADEMEARLKLYQELRKRDAVLFRQCLDDPVPEEWLSVKCPVSLLVFDYLLLVIGTILLISWLWFGRGNEWSWLAAVAWALLHFFPWCYGTTFVLWDRRCFWVTGEREDLAPVWRIICAEFLELLFVMCSFGFGMLLSLAFIVYGQKGQSVGEILLGVHIIEEVLTKVEVG